MKLIENEIRIEEKVDRLVMGIIDSLEKESYADYEDILSQVTSSLNSWLDAGKGDRN